MISRNWFTKLGNVVVETVVDIVPGLVLAAYALALLAFAEGSVISVLA